jgi:hypothetical protein
MAEKSSKTKYLQLNATIEWAKVFPENYDKTGPDGAYEGHDGAYTVDLLLDDEEYEKLRDAGSQKQSKETEDGLHRVKIIRKHTAPYTYGGAPQVAHIDGTPWDMRTDGLIGNGSKGVAYVSVYQVKGRYGTRLDGLQILDLVPYESEDDDAPRGLRIPDRSSQTSGSKNTQATEPAAKQPAKKPASKPLVEDEIPFDAG